MHMIRSKSKEFDFLQIWEMQQLPNELKEQLIEIAEDINDRLEDRPDEAGANLGEWTKKEGCWQNIKKMPVTLDPDIMPYLIDRKTKEEKQKQAAKGQGFQDFVDARIYVIKQGTAHWQKLKDWNLINKKLTEKEAGVIDYTIRNPQTPPSDKQAKLIISAEKEQFQKAFLSVKLN